MVLPISIVSAVVVNIIKKPSSPVHLSKCFGE